MILISLIEFYYILFFYYVYVASDKIGLGEQFFNEAILKLFIIFGILDWWDYDYIEHPLITLRIKIGGARNIKRFREMEICQ